MGSGGRVEVALFAEALEDLLDQADADTAVLADYQEWGSWGRGKPTRAEEREEACDSLTGGLVEWDAARAATFGMLTLQEQHLARPAFGGDVADVELDELANPQPGVGQQLDEPVVSLTEWGTAVDGLH